MESYCRSENWKLTASEHNHLVERSCFQEDTIPTPSGKVLPRTNVCNATPGRSYNFQYHNSRFSLK